MPQVVKLKDIVVDAGTQCREKLNPEVIDEYAEFYADVACAMPAILLCRSGTTYWLIDGFHRVAACRQAGKEDILADVIEGDLSAALWAAAHANAAHGLRRTRADKLKAVKVALSVRPDASNIELSIHCGVSAAMVREVRDAENVPNPRAKPKKHETEQEQQHEPDDSPFDEGDDGDPPLVRETVTDELGIEIIDSDQADKFTSAMANHREMMDLVKSVRDAVAQFATESPWFTGTEADQKMEELRGMIQRAKPYAATPAKCTNKAWTAAGYITQAMYRALPKRAQWGKK